MKKKKSKDQIIKELRAEVKFEKLRVTRMYALGHNAGREAAVNAMRTALDLGPTDYLGKEST